MDLNFGPVNDKMEHFQAQINEFHNIIQKHKLTFKECIDYLSDLWKIYNEYQTIYRNLGHLLNKLQRNKSLKPKPTKTKEIVNNFLNIDKKLIDTINLYPSLLKDLKQNDFYLTTSLLGNSLYLTFSTSEYLIFNPSDFIYNVDDDKVYTLKFLNRNSFFSVREMTSLSIRNLIYGSINKYNERLYIPKVEKPKIDDLYYTKKQKKIVCPNAYKLKGDQMIDYSDLLSLDGMRGFGICKRH